MSPRPQISRISLAFERHVAGDGRQSQHLEFWAGDGEHDRSRVVLAGVGIDDDLAGRHARRSLSFFHVLAPAVSTRDDPMSRVMEGQVLAAVSSHPHIQLRKGARTGPTPNVA